MRKILLVIGFLTCVNLHAAQDEYQGPEILTENGKAVGIVTLNQALTAPMAACKQFAGLITVEGLSFSKSGKTLESFYFVDSNDNNWSVPTNFSELSKSDNEIASSFIKVGKEYFVRLQACGSGGFVDLIDIYGKELNKKL
ncbi:hypothetical protein AAFL31_07515 [Klebsiella huaxiensis]|uniref:hypothetical protein n=1 Tax=Klebsiella huaxiensis TaxID=2153354 RepID=UPI00316214D7